MKYQFHADAAHGWLQVKRSELIELGIADKISRFSYQYGEFVFLEEDCDALRFVKAWEEKNGKAFEEPEEQYSETSNVRRFPNYEVK